MTISREDQFAGALAHQLKTPLAAMQAAAINMKRNLRGLLEELASMAGEAAPAGRCAQFVSRAIAEEPPRPHTGLLPQDRLDAIAHRLSLEGLEGDLHEAAASLLRGGWDTYLGEIAPLLRNDRSRTLDLLESAARLRGNLSAVESSLRKTQGLTSALRALSQPALGEPTEIRSRLENAAALVGAALPQGVRILTRLSPLPEVRGRADLLEEVWTNLIVNAAQAVGERGTIVVETETAPPGSRLGPLAAVVRIVDDGPGIAPENLPRIFEPRFTTRAAEGGSGVGLPLARTIVERMGGRIEVDSRPGRTCFTVLLPAAAAAAVEA